MKPFASRLLGGRFLTDKVPMIKRFSGGGTVIVDTNTIFASIIMNQVQEYVGLVTSKGRVQQLVGKFSRRTSTFTRYIRHEKMSRDTGECIY